MIDFKCPKITVIVPVYNVEKYLPQCIESIINQTYKNLEIILVDDGSLDKSKSICDEFAIIDNRILVIHKENGGVGSARNQGINIATGEYLYFADADDFLELNLIENCIEIINDKKPEIIIFGFNKVDFAGLNRKPILPPAHIIDNLDDDKEDLANIFNSGTGLAVWDKLINTKLLKDHKILFDNKKRGEDFSFVVKCLGYVKCLVSIHQAMYNYRIITGDSNKYDEFIIENHKENYQKLNYYFRLSAKSNRDIERFLSKIFVLWFALVIPLNIYNSKELNRRKKIELLLKLNSDVKIRSWLKEVKPELLSPSQKLIFTTLKLRKQSLLFLQAKLFSTLRKYGTRN